MQVTETITEGLKREFKIVIDAKDVSDRITVRLKRIQQTAHLKGFRPGKVPTSVLKQHYGKEVIGEALEEAVNTATTAAMDERSLRAAMKPQVIIEEFEEGNDLEYTLSIELMPEFPEIEYSKIKVERMVSEPEKQDVQKAVDKLASAQRSFDPAPDGHKAAKGDVVIVSFVGSIDGDEFDGGKSESSRLELGSNEFIPGFEDQLVGAKAGESREVKVTFPDDYGAANLKGRDAVFACAVKSIQVLEKIKDQDKLAERLGLENLGKLREAVTDQLKTEFETVAKRRVKRAILDALAEAHEFDVPPGLAEAEFDQVWKEFTEAQKLGEDDDDDKGKSEDELKEQYRDIALRRVRLGLLLSNVGQENNIAVTQEETDRAITEAAMKYPGRERQMMEFYRSHPEAAEELNGPILEDKVIDFIVGKAKITERKVSSEELLDESNIPPLGGTRKRKGKAGAKAGA